MSDKRLNLCFEHRQEINHSHFANHNCDQCKAIGKIEAVKGALEQWLEDMDDYTDAQYGKGQIRSILEGVCGKQ